MHFLRTPLELVPSSTGSEAVGGVKLEVNELRAREDGSQAAVGLGRHEFLPVRALQLHSSHASETAVMSRHLICEVPLLFETFRQGLSQ